MDSRRRFSMPGKRRDVWLARVAISLFLGIGVALASGIVDTGAWAQNPDWEIESLGVNMCGGHVAFSPDGDASVVYTQLGDSIYFRQKIEGAWSEAEFVAGGFGCNLVFQPGTGNALVPFISDGLKLATRGSAGNWSVESVCNDTIRYLANGLGFACNPQTGHPAIVYLTIEGHGKNRTSHVKLAEYDGQDWQVQTIRTAASNEWLAYPDLAFDISASPAPAVAYLLDIDGQNAVEFAHRNTQTQAWDIETVAIYNTPMIFGTVSLSFDSSDGGPSIVFDGHNEEEWNQEVYGDGKYAHKDPVTQEWEIRFYSAHPNCGGLGGWLHPSLVYDSAGIPFISHSWFAPGVMMSTRLGDEWFTERLELEEYGADSHQETSLALAPANQAGERLPVIVYTAVQWLYPDPDVYEVKFAQRKSLDFTLPPTVAVSSPADGQSFTSGDILFAGAAIDENGNDLSADLNWASSLDGVIGTGATFSRSVVDLTPGVHVIDASVTDPNNNKTGSASVSITFGSPSLVGVVSIDYAKVNRYLEVTFTVHDDFGQPITAALVHAELLRDGQHVAYATPYPTFEDGTITYSLKNPKPGHYTTIVTNVEAIGLAWDGVDWWDDPNDPNDPTEPDDPGFTVD